jgi:hypothetical protein
MFNNTAISVAATGQRTTTTVSTATAAAAIPLCSDGATKPKYVRFAATGTCYVRLAPSAGLAVAVVTDALVQVGAPVILAVHGNTHWSAIDDGVAAKVTVTPLEDA